MQQEEYIQSEEVNILVVGVPGAGKSTICNTLLTNNPDAKIFQSSNTVETGQTQNIQYKHGNLFGNKQKLKIKVFDLPGIGDTNIGPEKLVSEFQEKIGEGKSVDIALLVVKYNEQRMTFQQKASVAVLENFLTQIQPKCIIWVFTWCDNIQPDEKYVSDKIKSYKLCVQLPQNNIVFFTKLDPKTLYPIEKLLVKTEMKVANDLQTASQNILQKMDQWTDVPKQDMQLFIKMMMDSAQQQNANMMKVFQEINQQAIQQQDKQTQMLVQTMQNQLSQQQELMRDTQRQQQENQKFQQESQNQNHLQQLQVLQCQMESQRQLNSQLVSLVGQNNQKDDDGFCIIF